MPTTAEMIEGAQELCCVSEGILPAMKVWLLAQQLNPVPTLAEMIAGAQTLCCLDDSTLNAISVWLESEIADAGAATAGQVTCGSGAPTGGAPASGCGLYVDLVSTAVYYWNAGTASWILKV